MTTTARAILAGGLVTFSVWDTLAQKFYGFKTPVDADKFEIKPDFEEKVSESRSHLDYGQARASVILPKPTEVTVELSASSIEALAMQFQGLVQTLSQSSGSQTATSLVVDEVGVWLPIGKRNISDSGFLVTDATATTTYVLGTHYQVNWLRGEIMFLAVVGAPAKADTVKVTASWVAVDGKKILGGRVAQVRCHMRLDGQNMVNGEAIEVDVHDVALGSNNGFDFLGSDFSAITLSGKISGGYEIRFPQRSGI